jgi:hypothetical protein
MFKHSALECESKDSSNAGARVPRGAIAYRMLAR